MQLDLFVKPAEPKPAEGVDAVVDTQKEDGDVTDDENGDGSPPARGPLEEDSDVTDDENGDGSPSARGPLQKG